MALTTENDLLRRDLSAAKSLAAERLHEARRLASELAELRTHLLGLRRADEELEAVRARLREREAEIVDLTRRVSTATADTSDWRACEAAASALEDIRCRIGVHPRLQSMDGALATLIRTWGEDTCREIDTAIDNACADRLFRLDKLAALHPPTRGEGVPRAVRL